MAVIGIDLGTTNSLAAYWKDGRVEFIPDRQGNILIPSAVEYIREGKEELFRIGNDAGRYCPENGILVRSFKRYMGTEKQYVLGERTYTPMELSAMVLAQIRENAERFFGEEIQEAVITVPAYFNDKQRSDTKKAAQIAGLKVERLINEPSAAALAYRMAHGDEDKSLLVFDFGGGTLDLSYVECFDNVIEIIAVAGDNFLGGDDIDRLIAGYFCRQEGKEFELLENGEQRQRLQQAEQVKREGMDEDLLFELCMPLFARIKTLFLRLLSDAGVHVSELDDLIMVGGSSRLSVVKRFLTELLGKEPVVLGDTDMVVAMGAGVYTGIRQRREEVHDLLLTDVCPFTLGVESFHQKEDKLGYLLPMIERNSTLPAFRKERLVTLHDYQNAVTVKIYQGEEYYAKDNLYLGEVTIPVTPKKAGKEWIDVCFSYDINGLLHVEVVNAKQERSQILLANQQLSERELTAYKKELEKRMVSPLEQEKNKRLLEKASMYYEQSTGEKRQWIGSLMAWFVQNMESGRLYKRKNAVREMEHQLLLLEEEENTLEERLFDGEVRYPRTPVSDPGSFVPGSMGSFEPGSMKSFVPGSMEWDEEEEENEKNDRKTHLGNTPD